MADDQDNALKVSRIWEFVDQGRDRFKAAPPLIEQSLEEGNREAYKCFSWIEPALLNVGNFDDIEEFDKTRLRILEKAAKIYEESACYHLALEYEKGIYVSKSAEKAFELMERSAALDHRGACFKLATYLLDGIGCQVCVTNQREAGKIYYHLAFTFGHLKALYELANMSLSGVALPKNASFAFVLASCARSFGEQDSQNLLSEIEKSLSLEEKAEAEDLAYKYSSSRTLKIFGSFPNWMRTAPNFLRIPDEARLRKVARQERVMNSTRVQLNILSSEKTTDRKIGSS